MAGYLTVPELQLAIGGTRTVRPEDYERAIAAATSQIDRWTGRRFLRDEEPSTRTLLVEDCHRMRVGDFTDPGDVLVETDDAGDGTWLGWEPEEWQPEADDRGNGPYVRLDGEPWRWVGTAGDRLFPLTSRYSPEYLRRRRRLRVTTRWGWEITPTPVTQACLELAILYVQAKDRGQMADGPPIMEAKGLVMDYAVEGGTLYCRPLVG